MAKQKDKPADEKYGDLIISNMKLQSLEADLANQKCKNFDCSGNFFTDLSYAPGLVTGDFICKNNKKISGELNPMNQYHLGAGRFAPYGPEDEDVNRPVKVNGSYITDENVYKKPKIYDKSVGRPKEENEQKDDVIVDNNNFVRIKSNSISLVFNIKNPILAFELKGLPEFEARGQYGYGSWGNGKPVHGWFEPRQNLKGGTTAYGGSPPPGGWKGWGDPPYNLKNYVNWSYFESAAGNGAGPESEYKWGRYQADGATVYQGRQYGAKTNTRLKYTNNGEIVGSYTYYYLNNDPKLYRKLSVDVFKAPEGKTLEPLIKANNFENIRVAVTAAFSIIQNNKVVVGGAYPKHHPFFGKLDDETFFAGTGTGMKGVAENLLSYFNKKGKKVLWADIGDGGGSSQLALDGKMVVDSKRNVAVVIGW